MEVLLKFLGVIALVLIIAVVMSFPTMWLWNWLMPAIFGLTKISLAQAWGINVLSGVLFKNTTTK